MDMTPEAALVKLMWALGQTRDMKSVESLMLKPFAGELREIAGGVHG
jgi:glutamyl-tRNA(Gln) amidotransferase subunit D